MWWFRTGRIDRCSRAYPAVVKITWAQIRYTVAKPNQRCQPAIRSMPYSWSTHGLRDIRTTCTSAEYVPSSAVNCPSADSMAAATGEIGKLTVAHPHPDNEQRDCEHDETGDQSIGAPTNGALAASGAIPRCCALRTRARRCRGGYLRGRGQRHRRPPRASPAWIRTFRIDGSPASRRARDVGDRRPASADLAFTMSCHVTSLGGAPDEGLRLPGCLATSRIWIVRIPSGSAKSIETVVIRSLRPWKNPGWIPERERSRLQG